MKKRKGEVRTGENGCSISLYTGESANPRSIAVGIKKLQIAFPKMGKHFFDLLAERIDANDFTEKRLYDAVNNVIDNFQYRELNIADIIKFDRRVKLYTGAEFCNAQMNGVHCSKFEKREIEGVMFWILKDDLIKAGLKSGK